MLSVGTSCTVRAINARPELNGRRGVIVTELDEGGRVGVQVEGEAKPLSLKSTNVDVVSADESWVKLAMLGYHFVAGPSGDPCDLVLRQLADKTAGFAWRGQEDYDAVGAAVTAHLQRLLASPLCGLEAQALPDGVTVWASPGLSAHAGPVLLLIAGMAPGGAAAVWGRSLCINESTQQGAMFDCIRRAREQGWAVLVANPADGKPAERHLHLTSVWRALLAPSAARQPLLVIAHSYAAPAAVHLLKVEPAARGSLAALVLTDGWRFEGTSLVREALTDEVAAMAVASPLGRGQGLVAHLTELAAAAPAAAAEASPELLALLREVGRNYVASDLPSGTLVQPEREGFLCLSAGHTAHPATTAAATEHAFAFLARAVAGAAAQANSELRGAT